MNLKSSLLIIYSFRSLTLSFRSFYFSYHDLTRLPTSLSVAHNPPSYDLLPPNNFLRSGHAASRQRAPHPSETGSADGIVLIVRG